MIRGGDYAQVGYEFDGVPTNKAFDNYPANTLSSLGQQEVQIYTGPPVNAEASGSSGFINQVVRTGYLSRLRGFRPRHRRSAILPSRYRRIRRSHDQPQFQLLRRLERLRPRVPLLRSVQRRLAIGSLGTSARSGPVPATNKANFTSCYASGFGPGGYVLGPYNAGQPAHISDREEYRQLTFRNTAQERQPQRRYSAALQYGCHGHVFIQLGQRLGWSVDFSNNGIAFPRFPQAWNTAERSARR